MQKVLFDFNTTLSVGLKVYKVKGGDQRREN